MATAYRQITAANAAKLDALAGGAIVRGQPVQATNAPIQPTDVFTVKLCADGLRPDGTAIDAIDLGGTGRFAPRSSAALPALLGGAVAAGDLLKVSSGKWIKCSPGDQAWMRAMQSGASGDIVNAEPCDRTA